MEALSGHFESGLRQGLQCTVVGSRALGFRAW